MKLARSAGILAALAITLTGFAARADEPTPALTETPAPAGSAIPWLAQPSPAASFTAPDSHARPSRMLWIVLPALALGGAALYVKLAKRRAVGPLPSRKLQVLDTARVGPKAHVVVISVGGRQLLLGVTEQSVQRLAYVAAERQAPAAEAKREEEPAKDAGPPGEGPFAHILKSFTQSRAALPAGSDAALKIAAETQDFVERRTAMAEPVKIKVAPEDAPSPKNSDIEEQVSGLRKRRAGKLG